MYRWSQTGEEVNLIRNSYHQNELINMDLDEEEEGQEQEPYMQVIFMQEHLKEIIPMHVELENQ